MEIGNAQNFCLDLLTKILPCSVFHKFFLLQNIFPDDDIVPISNQIHLTKHGLPFRFVSPDVNNHFSSIRIDISNQI